eukprot:CAMPEP_0197026260 /NCGR_PEP_ID=MMETSP1384-20130603/6390_1 /TAXON_ID=29189 /ORGANISM="Ammonia sp." /LENGTH=158 /DNA_ID=CAMNT_0042454899 /DNA_START=17 /DNA_END=493 /DNA_ORIENTATION=+
MSSTLNVYCFIVIAYLIEDMHAFVHHTDVLNLHTYDFYDWFLLVFAIFSFGCVCLCVGWIAHRKWTKQSRLKSQQNVDQLSVVVDHNGKDTLNEQHQSGNVSTAQFVELNHLHKLKATLSPVYEFENENDLAAFPQTSAVLTKPVKNRKDIRISLTKR